MRLRHIAPAGAPIRMSDLLRSLGCVAGGRGAAALRGAIRERFGVRHVVLTSTGRAGMTLLLGALRRLAPGRPDVVIPSYTCFSVAAAIVKAGLRPRVVDISPDTLDYAPDELSRVDLSGVLAIVATNLYGLPNNLPFLRELTRRAGTYLIDDAAQAMGALVGGRSCGTWGDAGLFSLDKGKNVSAIDGGIIVTQSDPIAAAISEEAAALQRAGLATELGHGAKALAYWLFLRPWLYWIPDRLPQLGLGRTVYRTDFDMAHPGRFTAALGAAMLSRLDVFTRARVDRGTVLDACLRPIAGVTPIRLLAGAAPVYLRYPLLVDNPGDRTRLLDDLRAAGIGATGSYPAAIPDVPELTHALADGASAAPGGRYVAARIVTLPTHPMVSPGDIDTMLALVDRVAARRTLAGLAVAATS